MNLLHYAFRHLSLESELMPERRAGEKLSAFIGRFVSSKREKKKFPNLKQRLAVSYSEAREHARSEKR